MAAPRTLSPRPAPRGTNPWTNFPCVWSRSHSCRPTTRKVRAVFSANLTLGQYLNDERTTGGTDRKQRKALRQNSMKALQKLRQAVKSRLDEAAKMLAPVTIGVTSGDGELTMGGETAAV
jgi:hypothetical protein